MEVQEETIILVLSKHIPIHLLDQIIRPIVNDFRLAIASCTRSIVTGTRHTFKNPKMPLSSSHMKTLNGEEEEVHECVKLCFELQKRRLCFVHCC